MNTFKLTSYILVAAFVFAFVGCNDILEDTEPPTAVSGDVVLSSADGVEALRASMYSQLRSGFGFSTEYFVGPSAFADETFGRVGSSRMQGLNEARGTFGTTHLRPYNQTYSIILDANLLIGAIEDGVLPEETQDQYVGEAYAMRAFAMHHLVRSLGYEPNDPLGRDGEWDLGIILRTEPTIDVEDADARPRATVNDVYTQILDDLSQAKTLLAGTADRTRLNEAFVDGLTARVNLYAGNWAEASQAAQDGINNASDLSLASTEDEVANMFFETQDHTEGIFVLSINADTEAIGGGSNTNTGPAAYTSTQWVAQVPTQRVLDLYDDEDFRIGDFVRDDDGEIVVDEDGIRQYEGGWYQPCVDGTENDPQSGCDAANEDELSTNKFNGAKGNLADDLRYMRLAELYLIWAEAAAKDAGSAMAGADALDQLREARGLDPIAVANPDALTSVEAFEDEILDERMRELIVEGHRFWDLKRTGRDVRTPDGSLKIAADSYRILANIGATLRNVNPELEENPGY